MVWIFKKAQLTCIFKKKKFIYFGQKSANFPEVIKTCKIQPCTLLINIVHKLKINIQRFYLILFHLRFLKHWFLKNNNFEINYVLTVKKY